MWEVLEFAKLPYFDLSDESVLDGVVRLRNVTLRQPMTPVQHRERL